MTKPSSKQSQLIALSKQLLEDKLNYYIEVSKFAIDNQSGSFSAIDTKAGILLTLVTALTLLVTQIADSRKWSASIVALPCPFNYLFAILFLSYFLINLFGIYSAYRAIKTREFDVGMDPADLREFEKSGLVNIQLLEEISKSYQKAVSRNSDELDEKYRWYNYAETTMVYTILLTLFILLFISTT